MSTRKKSKGEYVIIRAFGDEPVLLKAVGVHGRAIEAVGDDEATPMPFNISRAFAFRDSDFQELRAAYDQGQRTHLLALWEKAAPYLSGRTA